MGMVHYNYVEQHLLTIQFSPEIPFSLAIRFYKQTSGIIVNNNKYWLTLNLYGIWILEHKGATTLQKLGGNSGEAWISGAKHLRFEGGAKSEGEAQEKAGEGSREGLSEPLPRNCLEFRTSNRYIWCMVEREILSKKGSIKIGGSWPLDPHWLRSCLSRL